MTPGRQTNQNFLWAEETIFPTPRKFWFLPAGVMAPLAIQFFCCRSLERQVGLAAAAGGALGVAAGARHHAVVAERQVARDVDEGVEAAVGVGGGGADAQPARRSGEEDLDGQAAW